VEIHSAGVDDTTGTPYLVMELLQGEDLLTRVERASLGKDELFEVFEQICHAMGAAHDRGIWALGLMVYHALVGRSFWQTAGDADATSAQILKEVLFAPIPEAGERAREQGFAARVSPEVAGVISRSASSSWVVVAR
jgi:hypothetical protein